MDFVYHVAIIVIPESTAQLLVVHRGFVFSPAPLLRHLLRVIQFELTIVSNPHDEMAAAFLGEQLQKELPQLDLSVVAYRENNQW